MKAIIVKAIRKIIRKIMAKPPYTASIAVLHWF